MMENTSENSIQGSGKVFVKNVKRKNCHGIDVDISILLSPSSSRNRVELHESERVFLRTLKSGDVNYVSHFLESGVDVNYSFRTTVEGMIPLQIACLNNKDKLVEFLLNDGADANFQSPRLNNWTPLHLSILNIKDFHFSFNTIRNLLDHGAAWRLKDNNGDNFLQSLDKKQSNIDDHDREPQFDHSHLQIYKSRRRYRLRYQKMELIRLVEHYFEKYYSLRVCFNQSCSRCRAKPFVTKMSFVKGGASYCMNCRDVFPIFFEVADDQIREFDSDEAHYDHRQNGEEESEGENLGIFNKNELMRIVSEQRKEIQKLKEVILLKERLIIEREKRIMALEEKETNNKQ